MRKIPTGTLRYFFDTDDYEFYDGEKWVAMLNPKPDVPSGQVLRVADNGNLNWSNMPSNELHPTNCPNCGAPLHNGNCEYCGTEVFRI